MVPRWNQTPLPGSETTEVLQGATGTLHPWLPEVVKTWTSQNMNVRLHTDKSTERSMLSAGEEKEVGSVRSTIAPEAGICTMGTSMEMNMVPC